MVARAAPQMSFNFDQVKTRTVQRLINQLIKDVMCISEYNVLEPGLSAEPYIVAVERTVHNFLTIGEDAVRECPMAVGPALDDLNHALLDVRTTGDEMVYMGREFVKDTNSSERRAAAGEAGRQLLQAIARMLILADIVDVALIIDDIEKTRGLLHSLKSAESNNQVLERYQALHAQIEQVDETTRRRVRDLASASDRDDAMAATAMLKTTAPMVLATTKTFVRHPEFEAARLNRDYAHDTVVQSLDALRAAMDGRGEEGAFSRTQHGGLIAELDNFQNRVFMDPSSFRSHVHRPELEELLERIVSGSALIADSSSTRSDRKQKIIDECNNLRQALQDLLNEYERNCGRSEGNEDVDLAMVLVGRKTKDLRRHLRRAVVDHVSDALLDTRTPLLILIDAAKKRDTEETAEAGEHFMRHAHKLVEVANLVCEMSSDGEGVRVIRYTAAQLANMAPQVVNAAQLLCARGDSQVAKDNMEAFRQAWTDKVRLLTMAIDSIVSLDDFLAVSEAHIVEDAMAGVQAVQETNADMLDRAAGAIRGRSLRVCDVVEEEMEQAPGPYADKVRTAAKRLREDLLGEFARRAEGAVERVADPSNAEDVSEEWITACTLVNDGVRDIRNALLLNRAPEDVDSDNDYEDDGQTHHEGRSQVSDGDNQQRVMRRLPEEEKKKIQDQIEVFKITQTKFEREVAKWDDTGNDIIQIAKRMCEIMMNMTDFTRGRGPLKSTNDVITAAQEISKDGARLNALAKQIGEESVDSNTKNDLFAYLARITLYCQQLNICSRVKADVQQVGNELVVSGLDSATSLIQTARNLLSAVVLTVKAAYIASTKFRKPNASGGSGPRVEWRMAPPQKQPLVKSAKPHGVVRRASERRPMQPMRALAEFQSS